MKFLLTTLALVASVLCAALSPPDIFAPAPSVTMTLSHGQTCAPKELLVDNFTVGTKCVQFPAGTESLKVVDVAGKFAYNSRESFTFFWIWFMCWGGL